jgi:hypothetical protein
MTTEDINQQLTGHIASRRRKPSSAASNVAQAIAKSSENVDLIAASRAEHGTSPSTGEPTLIAKFPRGNGQSPCTVDLSFLLSHPGLQPMFTDAFLSWGQSVSSRKRIDNKYVLQRYFFSYLSSVWSNTLTPEDIDDELLIGFKNSLLNKSKSDAKLLHPTTVNATLSTLRTLLGSLNTGPWADDASRITEVIPPGVTGADQKSEPIGILGFDQLMAILSASERKVQAIEERFSSARTLIKEGQLLLQAPGRIIKNTRSDFLDFRICLATIEDKYDGVMPNLPELRAEYPSLFQAISYVHTQTKIDSYFLASSCDLVPFALLLTIATVFNVETVLKLRWRDIDFNKDQAGTPAIEIIGEKGRATRDLVRLLDPNSAASSELSLKRILECLKNITSRARQLLTSDEDYIFAFLSKNRRNPRAFSYDLDASDVVYKSMDGNWGGALTHFIKENGLPKFTLKQLRPSILDLVQFMDGSLEAARKVGDHRSPATTWTHYTSGAVRSRYRERIGQIILLRERWFESDGVIDPRRLAPGQDKGAATPGFSCLDPFESPRPNQQSGKLCKDYGGCPSCPMAAAHPADAQCVAHYTALEVAIYRSQSTMSSKTWIERWVPVLSDLAALRDWIPPNVLETSREISVQLPNVG